MSDSKSTEQLHKILFDFQNDSFRSFNELTRKEISRDECVEGMVKSRDDALEAVLQLFDQELAKHDSTQCPRCQWEAGKTTLPVSKPLPHDCACTEYGPCLKHRDEMKESKEVV